MKCAVCNADNPDFAIRCKSCGANLQDSVKALDLFFTIYSLWRFPVSTFRKIILARHRNYTLLIAALEGIGLAFVMLFIVKAADIYSVQFPVLLLTGVIFGVTVFTAAIYFFSVLGYFVFRARRTGASLKGFVSGVVYALHPIAAGTLLLIPMEVAVFGSYLFSNNPSPAIINAGSFYPLAFLDLVFAAGAFFLLLRMTKLVFGNKSTFIGLSMLFLGTIGVFVEIGKRILLSK